MFGCWKSDHPSGDFDVRPKKIYNKKKLIATEHALFCRVFLKNLLFTPLPRNFLSNSKNQKCIYCWCFGFETYVKKKVGPGWDWKKTLSMDHQCYGTWKEKTTTNGLNMVGESQKVGAFDSYKKTPSWLRLKKSIVMDVTFLAHSIGKYYRPCFWVCLENHKK